MRDSNPRTREGQRFSRPPHSTTLPTLQYVSLKRDCKGTNKFETCKLFFTFLKNHLGNRHINPKAQQNHIEKSDDNIMCLGVHCASCYLIWAFQKSDEHLNLPCKAHNADYDAQPLNCSMGVSILMFLSVHIITNSMLIDFMFYTYNVSVSTSSTYNHNL